MRVLYGLAVSGHVHRVRLFLSILKLDYRAVEVAPHDPVVEALNPLGQIPVFQDGDLTLCDSNAILVYLARKYAPGSSWLPTDPIGEAHVQRWFSIAAGEIRFGLAAARAATLWKHPKEELLAAQARGRRFLPILEKALTDRTFLTGTGPTLADLACYAYVARAPEGGLSLDACPSIRNWLHRVEALPGFVSMPETQEPFV
ncbi:glutathione S-transferase family protein [Gluconobacter morbifer]|uniref:Glutathione S-transferase n=1 Tax=Gluconobacter morbifer G707 TaxID=1088869 RepID=G6XJZ2_9PROT|nr:glutathione S-transferase N-terminal domain-containing protein [Gluconobacter morbifer]EHH67954.1 glutathione S-transferase [Gluconobacter morbifer G707]